MDWTHNFFASRISSVLNSVANGPRCFRALLTKRRTLAVTRSTLSFELNFSTSIIFSKWIQASAHFEWLVKKWVTKGVA
jgi:hypothetical protein